MKYLRQAVLIGFLSFSCVGMSSPPKQLTGGSGDKESKFIKPEAIQGCYELGTLNWRPDLKLGEDEVFITPPKRIQILAEHGSTGFGSRGYLVRPAPGTPPSIHRSSYWEPIGPNAIEMVFTTGTSGLSMRLKVEGGILKGKAKTFWDFLRRHQTAHIVAPKIDCEKGQ